MVPGSLGPPVKPGDDGASGDDGAPGDDEGFRLGWCRVPWVPRSSRGMTGLAVGDDGASCWGWRGFRLGMAVFLARGGGWSSLPPHTYPFGEPSMSQSRRS